MDNGLNGTDKENGMNGWQRLWVLGCGILAVATIAFGVDRISRENDIQDYHDQLMVSYQAKIKDLQHPNNDAIPGILYSARTDHLRTVDEVKSAIRHAEDDYKNELANLPWKQAKQVALLFAIWLGCCLAVYGAGLILRWVYRGFRPKKV